MITLPIFHNAKEHLMSLYRVLFTAIILLLSTASFADGLKLAVFPYNASTELIKIHTPLKEHLQKETKQSVTMVSAPDFKQFLERSRSGEYDIIIIAPHLGKMLSNEGKASIIAQSKNYSCAVFTTLKESKINSIEELNNASIALPPKQAIINFMARLELEKELKGKTPDIIDTKSHDSALQSVLEGRSDAAAFGVPTYEGYIRKGGERLKEIGRSGTIPGFFILVNNDLKEDSKHLVKKALFSFQETKEGKKYFKDSALIGFEEPSKINLESIDDIIDMMNRTK